MATRTFLSFVLNRMHKSDIKPAKNHHLNFQFLLSFIFICFLALASESAYAQTASTSNSDGVVYRFEVDGISESDEANAFQLKFTQHELIRDCKFISECACFKMTSNEPLSYESLEEIVQDGGYQLSVKVLTSDGRVLKSKITQTINNAHGN